MFNSCAETENNFNIIRATIRIAHSPSSCSSLSGLPVLHKPTVRPKGPTAIGPYGTGTLPGVAVKWFIFIKKLVITGLKRMMLLFGTISATRRKNTYEEDSRLRA
jgi:hypothetical protein